MKEGDCLGEDGVVVVQGRGEDSFIEDGVSQDVDQQNFSLGDREAEEVDGDFDCRGVEDGGHTELGEHVTLGLGRDERRLES